MALPLLRGIAGQDVPLPAVLQSAAGAEGGRPIAAALLVSMVTVSLDGATEAAGAGTLTELGDKRSVYFPTQVETEFAFTLVVAIDAGAGSVPTSTLCDLQLGDYDGGVWIDTDAVNTNTLVGRDGTRQVPVSTAAAAKTIADAAGFQKYFIKGSVNLTLGAAHLNWTFQGASSFPTVDLNGQNADQSIFERVLVTGIMNAAQTDALYSQCIIDSVTNMQGGLFVGSELRGTIDVSNSAVADFLGCYSGTGTAAVTLTIGNKDQVNVGGHNGKLIIDGVTGAATRVDVSFNSGDELELLATNTNGTIKPAGPVALVDNSGVGATVDLSSAVLIADGYQNANQVAQQGLILEGVPMMVNDTGQATFTVDALKNAPSGASITDWTPAERDQIRFRLQMDGVTAAPAADAPAQLLVTTSVIAATAIDTIWDEIVETGATARESLRLSNAASASKTNGSPTTSFNLRDLADTKNRIAATVDANGNRTAITRDVA